MKYLPRLLILVTFALLMASFRDVLKEEASRKILIESVALFIGTSLLVQCLGYAIMGLRLIQLPKQLIAATIRRLPVAFGFISLVAACILAISAEVFLLRHLIHPSDSWVLVTAGFVFGIASVDSRRRGFSITNSCEQAEDTNPPPSRI